MEKKALITAVYPVVNGNGANYIAMNLAFQTKEKHPNKKVALLDFDFANPNLGVALIEDEVHGIDNLMDKLYGNVLTDELFLDNMIQIKDGIDLLRGSKMGHFQNFIAQSHLDLIVEKLGAHYDYVFISCSASHLDSGTPTALFKADRLAVVARHNFINEVQTRKTVQIIQEMYNKENVKVMYNFYAGQSKAEVSADFAKWEVIGLIPHQPETIDNLDLVKTQFVRNKKSKDVKAVYGKILEKMDI